jgi:O-antigen/teichoic acid export membrane protein
MRGIAHQAVVLSIVRMANLGLLIISPLVLVRFLTVTDFGRYREFLLYVSLLGTIASFSINESLLYFIPLYPRSTWRIVRETTVLTAIISSAVVVAFVVVDLLVPGGLVGPYLFPVVLYVLLFANVDFWETFWIATHRPMAVFAYTAGRLTARMLVVVCVAVMTTNVSAIIWSLIALEVLRLLGATIAWKALDRSRHEPSVGDIRREQLEFCVPYGLSGVLSLLSKNLGNVVITKYLGVVALAQLSIGTYADPIILVLRNSISSVVLPELVRRLGTQTRDEALRFWHRSVLINCILLFPIAAIMAWYAEPLIVKAFGGNYRPAVPVLQWFALVVVRSCFDFSPLLRAINKTRPFMTVGLVALLVNALVLAILIPRIGIVGAAIAVVAANFADALYQGFCVIRLYGCGLSQLLPWAELAKITSCTILGAVVAFGVTWELRGTFAGSIYGSLLYGAVFATMLLAARVREASTLLDRLKSLLRYA